jgi:N6-adenosine-specific RNA methylase IME4
MDGGIISGQGIPPTYTKPSTELLLLATTAPRGRPFPLQGHALPQVVLAPREAHSRKPAVFRELIVRGYGDRSRIELFARERVKDWDAWGDEL